MSFFYQQLMMGGLDGSGGSGPSCNLGKDDSGYCGGGLFSEGKVRFASFKISFKEKLMISVLVVFIKYFEML